jgi:tether containing UBX domain for GLUT4
LAALPQGARIELIQGSRSPTPVTLAVQLPDNVRVKETFPSNTSFWQILRVVESKTGGNITQRGFAKIQQGTSGQINYEMPVVHVKSLRKELRSFVELQQTLSQLGVTKGLHLLELSFTDSGKPLLEMQKEISDYFKDSDVPLAVQSNQSATKSEQPKTVPSNPEPNASFIGTASATQSTATPMEDVTSTVPNVNTSETAFASPLVEPGFSSAQNSTITGPGDRQITIYAPSSGPTPAAAQQPYNPSDYEPTIEHVRRAQGHLQEAGKNKKLLSDEEIAEKEAARNEKLASIKQIKLRIRMPDQSQIDMIFKSDDPAQDVYASVTGLLRYPEEPFRLMHVGSTGRQVPLPRNTQRLTKDLGLKTNTLMTLAFEESVELEKKRHPLKDEWASKAVQLEVKQPEPVEAEPVPTHGGSNTDAKGKGKMNAADKLKKMENMLGKHLGFGKKK